MTLESTGPRVVSRLAGADRLLLVLALAVVAVAAAPRLPPGICFDDFGDLQAASTLGGIMHPTGYAGYASLGWLVTRIPGVDPAAAVTVACLGAGLIALALAMLVAIRLGASVPVAGAGGLLLAAHPAVWTNLVAPEVYAPTLAFLAGAVLVFLDYARTGSRRRLGLAALLLGIAVANRPPVLLMLPFFLAAGWTARGPRDATATGGAVSLGLALALGLVPSAYSAAYFWIRDDPATTYNYVAQYDRQQSVVPGAGDGPGAKLERIAWLARGRQFQHQMGNDWKGIRARLHGLRHDLLGFAGEPVGLGVVVLAALGAIAAARRRRLPAPISIGAGALALGFGGLALAGHLPGGDTSPPAAALTSAGLSLLGITGLVLAHRRFKPAAWLLGGMGLTGIAFLCAYRVTGQAADVLSPLLAGTVLVTVAASALLDRFSNRTRRRIGLAILAALALVTLLGVEHRPSPGLENDAIAYVEAVDLESLPPDAVVIADWRRWPPLMYAREALTDRSDLEIVYADPERWSARACEFEGRPIYVTGNPGEDPDLVPSPRRPLWRPRR